MNMIVRQPLHAKQTQQAFESLCIRSHPSPKAPAAALTSCTVAAAARPRRPPLMILWRMDRAPSRSPLSTSHLVSNGWLVIVGWLVTMVKMAVWSQPITQRAVVA
jgi:hypothetical protein